MGSRILKVRKAKARARRAKPRREERAAITPGPAEEILFGTEVEEL